MIGCLHHHRHHHHHQVLHLCLACLVFPFLCCGSVLLPNDDHLRFVPKRQKEHVFSSGGESVETLSWVVKLNADPFPYAKEELDAIADVIAKDTRLVNLGQVGDLKGYYLYALPRHVLNLVHSDSTSVHFSSHEETRTMRENITFTSRVRTSLSEWSRVKHSSMMSLDSHPYVDWHIQQIIRTRTKRDFKDATNVPSKNSTSGSRSQKRSRSTDKDNPLHFNDPYFPEQWHLVNTYNRGRDINVTGVWLHNITGQGITIAVIDDGLEWKNPDLLPNYNPEGSYDLNSDDTDPTPSTGKDTNHHGTRCAGEIAAVANNDLCGVGVAYRARISGIRVLDGPMTDDLEAVAFTKKLDVKDVFSCSWGPEDDGKTVDGPQHLAMTAMRHGVDFGRGGYGAVYVVASGNGGRSNDNCNYDGYANSIYTVTIGAIDEDGEMPDYGEPCASMLAVTYSSGGGQRNIVTTDWTLNKGTGCTENHSGTSAAAPIASSLIGLMLEARPCLTWRDVQYIIVVSAVKVDVLKSEWVRNAAGLYHSHQHGFGEMKAWRMVNTAKVWKTVPWLISYTSEEIKTYIEVPTSGFLESNYNVTEEMLDGYYLNTLEYVHIVITLEHERRGDVRIELICPSQTSSVIGAPRNLDESKDGFQSWTFSTVRCWGERPVGTWSLRISDTGKSEFRSRGTLVKWQLQLYGSMLTPDEVAERIRLVDEASSGKYLNDSFHLPCSPPPVHIELVEPVSERVLKLLLLTGCFMLFVALYETLEYAFCYNEEKEEHSKYLRLTEEARELSGQPDEATRLLSAEEIEMEPISIDISNAPSGTNPGISGDNNGTAGNCTAFSNQGVTSEQDLLLALDEELTENKVLLNCDTARTSGLGAGPAEDLLVELGKELALDNGTLETAQVPKQNLY